MEEEARVTWNTLTMATPTSGEPLSPAQNDDDDPQQQCVSHWLIKYFSFLSKGQKFPENTQDITIFIHFGFEYI